MNLECVKVLQDELVARFNATNVPQDWSIDIEICPSGQEGDITINCFRFAKLLNSNPMAVADAVADILNVSDDVIKAEKIKAFVNVTLKGGAVHRATVAKLSNVMDACELDESQKSRILIEFSAPNTNKPQHLGHVRNNVLGMSLASLLKRVGHDVVPVNLVNDRGIHICKSMIAYQRWGNNETPETSGIKGDHLVGKYYVIYATHLKEAIAALKAEKPELCEGKSDDDLFLETELGQATQKMLLDWEAADSDVRELWQKMNNWVFAGFDETYKRIGVEFDHTYLESDTYVLGKDIVERGVKMGVFEKREDGAIFVDLDKLGKKVVLRSDGTSVYITQDLGTTVKKAEDFKPEKQYWVVGDEQIHHFNQLFATLKKLGYEWADGLNHLSYGMVNLPTGKMKSREGTVVDADDLFEEMVVLAKNSTLERCGDDIPVDIDERSEIIGLGALKFMLLKFNPKTTIKFNPEESIRFEGDTGPYVQYACARINSMEEKAAEQGIVLDDDIDWNLMNSEFEKGLSIRAYKYGEALKVAAEKSDCSILVLFLLDLAKDFNRFYRECPVLKAETDDLKKSRLALSCRVRDILVDGLKTLTIQVPKAM